MLADPYSEKQDWDWPCSTKPVPIDSRATFTSLTGSGLALCGLAADGALLCWGGPLMGDREASTLWSARVDDGALPPQPQQRFLSRRAVMTHE